MDSQMKVWWAAVLVLVLSEAAESSGQPGEVAPEQDRAIVRREASGLRVEVTNQWYVWDSQENQARKKSVVFEQVVMPAVKKGCGHTPFSAVLKSEAVSGVITLSGAEVPDHVLIRFSTADQEHEFAAAMLTLEAVQAFLSELQNPRPDGSPRPGVGVQILWVCGCVGWYSPNVLCANWTPCGGLCPGHAYLACRWYLVVVWETPADDEASEP